MIDKTRLFAAIAADARLTVSAEAATTLGLFVEEWEKRGLRDRRWLAYMMATTLGECGARMQPIRESLNYSVEALLAKFSRSRISEADARKYGRSDAHAAAQEVVANILYGGEFGRANLSNTEPGDGFRFRGRGFVQLTGRINYRRIAERTGVDLLADPDRALEPRVATLALFEGAIGGIYTGKKLADYFPAGGPPDWTGARRVINAQDKAPLFATYGQAFLAAIEAALPTGGDRPAPIPPPPDIPTPEPPQASHEGFLAWLLRVLFGPR